MKYQFNIEVNYIKNIFTHLHTVNEIHVHVYILSFILENIM